VSRTRFVEDQEVANASPGSKHEPTGHRCNPLPLIYFATHVWPLVHQAIHSAGKQTMKDLPPGLAFGLINITWSRHKDCLWIGQKQPRGRQLSGRLLVGTPEVVTAVPTPWPALVDFLVNNLDY
jgi:hypothetical protein